MTLAFKILIGTHHKTGTAWMDSIFRSICRSNSLKFHAGTQETLPSRFDVFLEDHSKFDFASLLVPYRGLYMIRDPRDVIISGCFYHQKSTESWLHRPRPEFNGLTYQQKINSYKNADDQILFEMENVGYRTTTDMVKWDYKQPEFCEVKYEPLIEDPEMTSFREAFWFLGFPPDKIPKMLEITYKNSLFSNALKKSDHVRSGKPNQWKQHFKQIHRQRFRELFGDALIRLKYEEDDSWISAE